MIEADIKRRGGGKSEPDGKEIVDWLDEHGCIPSRISGLSQAAPSMNAAGVFMIPPAQSGCVEFSSLALLSKH
ncbi:hypothetical protein [Mesorhizobium sp. M0491]|uniref:hypothetical protein n=1 Tax=Mesorhizobium sp. M0491 TaxID=2956950 RepID=UPI00333A88C8